MSRHSRILLLIDYLGSGGAQRQMCNLAILLKQEGCDVGVITYFEGGFFDNLLEESRVTILNVKSNSRVQRILAVRRAVRNFRPDILISFLHTPNMIAEVSGLPRRSFKIIVSERNTDITGLNFKKKLRFLMHHLADAVVTNSFAQRDYIKNNAESLLGRLHVIGNCVDLDAFPEKAQNSARQRTTLRVLVLGRIHPQKNPFSLVSALSLLKTERPDLKVEVDWYGESDFTDCSGQGDGRSYKQSLVSFITKHSLECQFRLHEPRLDVVDVYHDADVFCLPSLYEGCSNVIGEAMSCALPILASRAGDNERLVKDGANGYLFDPNSIMAIAGSIERFCALSGAQRREMGLESRRTAEELLSTSLFSKKYLTLIDSLK